MAIDIQRIAPELNVWIVRLNGDGTTFDAVCTVKALDEQTLFAEGALSSVPQGMQRMMIEAKSYFSERGYRAIEFVHKHRHVRRLL